MNATTATDFITTHKGFNITVNLADGSTISGDALSVNSKGVNIKIDGKTKSIALSKVVDLELTRPTEDDENLIDGELADEVDADEEAFMDASEAEANGDDFPVELHDGMTTRELADALGTDPKSLRVVLRSLGMGVGKGRKYSLAPAAYDLVKVTIAAAS